MKLSIFRISLIILIILTFASVIFAWQIFQLQTHAYNPKFIDTSPLGNKLSSYFYFLNTNNAKLYYLIRQHKLTLESTNDPVLKNFYSNWKWRRSNNPIRYQSLPRSAWTQIEYDGTVKKNYLLFWQNARPRMREFYKQNLAPINVAYPVVHFRCSDSPFHKHVQYHLTKAKTVHWMAQQIKDRGFDQIIMLSCNAHRSLDDNSCATYINYYANIFTANGIKVTTQCNSILTDFSMMVQSPLLVALNSSSYSFMAGIAKEPQDFISCNMGYENDGNYLLQNEADWIMSNDMPLLHRQISDYHNTAEVLEKLSKD